MQSDQEKILKILSDRSVGAYFAFAPDEFRKGAALREPADLVWVCNGCVLLFYLCRKKEHESIDVRSKNRRKAIEHNLNQARGWLRHWKSGARLTGANSNNVDFDLGIADCRHIIIVSVVASGADWDEYHQEQTYALGVTLCASLSQETVEALARSRASFFDFVSYIDRLRMKVRSQSSDRPNLVNEWRAANAPSVSAPKVDLEEGLIQRLHSYIMGVRTVTAIGRDGRPSQNLALFFNDLSLFDYMRIVYGLRQCVEAVGPTHRNCVVLGLVTNSGPVVITAAGSQNLLETRAQTDGVLAELVKQKPGGQRILITYETGMGVPIFAMRDRIGRTCTEKLLDAAFQQQYCRFAF